MDLNDTEAHCHCIEIYCINSSWGCLTVRKSFYISERKEGRKTREKKCNPQMQCHWMPSMLMPMVLDSTDELSWNSLPHISHLKPFFMKRFGKQAKKSSKSILTKHT